MLRVNNEYLDFDDFIEVEKKVKLFEEIDETQGDFSYSSTLPLTSNNIRILGLPFPDLITKQVYETNNAEILTDEGAVIYRGSVRVEVVTKTGIQFSFFSGNTNWFKMLTSNMTDLRLSKYDVDLTESNIDASWDNTSGIIFPLIDTGALVTRGYSNAVTEDFVGCFYIHTLLRETFQQAGLKIQGELLEDPFFLSLVVCTNTRNKQQITDRETYAGITGTQALPDDTVSAIETTNDSTGEFFDGAADNFDTGTLRYTADREMTVRVTGTATIDNYHIYLQIYKNGLNVKEQRLDSSGTIQMTLRLQAGDYVEYAARTVILLPTNLTAATLRITPIFVYETLGVGSVPLWSQQQFVSNVLRLFNTVTSFDEFTKTVTINLFDKIKHKTPVDISEHIEVESVDYSDFISSYGKKNTFSYQEPDDEDLREYNITSFLKYGVGELDADNEFLPDYAEVVESDFATPVSYQSLAFNASLERINFVELEELESGTINSVSDASGLPQFNITDADEIFEDGDLVRIETDLNSYNGDFVVTAVTSTYIRVRGLNYDSDADGTVTLLAHSFTTNDSVYIFSLVRKRDTNDIFDKNSVYLDDLAKTSYTIGFFNLLRLGRAIENDYKQGLTFGEVNSPLFFQRTLLSRYWVQFDRIINDPVKLFLQAYFPLKVYNQLDFLSPVTIRTIETSNMYYVNRITGYEDQSKTCRVELIKLP